MTTSYARTTLSILVLAAVGCGYALVGRGNNIPDDVQSVFIEPLLNNTQRSEVEQFLTESLASELVTRRRFSIAGNAAEADAKISGAVTDFRVTPITFTADGRAEEYEITIVADMRFERTATEELLWSAERYMFRETYELELDAVDFFDQENVAIIEASARFAETIASDLLEGF
jgi:outer membrane lipopolysaccharide assembly protein LptE/RlpB